MKTLYIICFTSKCKKSETGILLGFLPLYYIPEGSILRSAIFSSSEMVDIHESGLLGIYQDKELAEEHLKLEKEWRQNDIVWLTEIIIPKEEANNDKM